jgi:hypothetical protein
MISLRSCSIDRWPIHRASVDAAPVSSDHAGAAGFQETGSPPMFGRRSQQKPRLPDLDSEVAAHWNRGLAPSNPKPAERSSADSLEFAASAYTPTTKERSRFRRRLLLSLSVALILGPIFVAAAFYLMHYINPVMRATETLGERMTFGEREDEEIFYSDDVSAEQALQLGAFLQHEGIFNGKTAKSVRISKRGVVFLVGFAVEWNSWEQPDVVADFHDLRRRLSAGAFNGCPVEVHLCARQADSKGQMMPVMRILRVEDEP